MKRKKVMHALNAALDTGLWEMFVEADLPIAPRHFVEMQTSSSYELGRAFKKHLRDVARDQKAKCEGL